MCSIGRDAASTNWTAFERPDMNWENLPHRQIPNGILGPTKRFRQQNIDVLCHGKCRRIGWLLFGKDGSFYFHPKGKSPVIQVGNAVQEDGKLVKLDSHELSAIPLEGRTGIHLSLHPSGRVHVKGSAGKEITVAEIGPWLPVRRRFVFAYVYTVPVGNLPEVSEADPATEMRDPGRSLRLDLMLCPLNEEDGQVRVPYYHSTIYVGFSPRYAVLVNATPVPPCEPVFFFLASPIVRNPEGGGITVRTKARKTVARCERLLQAVGHCCGHVVSRPHDGTWKVTVSDLLDSDHRLSEVYVVNDRINKDTLLHDLKLLAGYSRIGFEKATGARDSSGGSSEGAPATWLVVLTTQGLEHLLESEKTWLQRAYEKNPPAWWMVGLTLVSTAIAAIALLKSYGVI